MKGRVVCKWPCDPSPNQSSQPPLVSSCLDPLSQVVSGGRSQSAAKCDEIIIELRKHRAVLRRARDIHAALSAEAGRAGAAARVAPSTSAQAAARREDKDVHEGDQHHSDADHSVESTPPRWTIDASRQDHPDTNDALVVQDPRRVNGVDLRGGEVRGADEERLTMSRVAEDAFRHSPRAENLSDVPHASVGVAKAGPSQHTDRPPSRHVVKSTGHRALGVGALQFTPSPRASHEDRVEMRVSAPWSASGGGVDDGLLGPRGSRRGRAIEEGVDSIGLIARPGADMQRDSGGNGNNSRLSVASIVDTKRGNEDEQSVFVPPTLVMPSGFASPSRAPKSSPRGSRDDHNTPTSPVVSELRQRFYRAVAVSPKHRAGVDGDVDSSPAAPRSKHCGCATKRQCRSGVWEAARITHPTHHDTNAEHMNGVRMHTNPSCDRTLRS